MTQMSKKLKMLGIVNDNTENSNTCSCMKVRLLLQKAIESNVKPQPVKPQHKCRSIWGKPRTFGNFFIV